MLRRGVAYFGCLSILYAKVFGSTKGRGQKILFGGYSPESWRARQSEHEGLGLCPIWPFGFRGKPPWSWGQGAKPSGAESSLKTK